MKNNRGMVLSMYIYILLVFFLLILATMLMVLNNTKLLATKMKNNISNQVKVDISDFSIVLLDSEDYYTIQGFDYVDPGYVAETTSGTSITAKVTSNVDTSTLGTYTYTYTITYGGISKSVTRNVTVLTAAYLFDYTGAAQTFTVQASGFYKLETWGGSGGIRQYAGTIYDGYGGYSKGVVYLKKNQKIYIYVGGQGNTTTSANTIVAGGYNGGGQGYSYSDSRGGASGGGATHIAKSEGLLSTMSTKGQDILIVAGGGGGADQCCAGYTKYAGNGGGYLGTDGLYNSVYVYGGTQSAGGSGTYSGTFGQGGICTANDCAGGGGGFYGGGANSAGGGYGAGGSGYIANPELISYVSTTKSMYCYNCTTSATASTLTNTTTNVSSTATANYAKIGNGYAKITYVGISEPTRTNTKLNDVRYIKDCTNGNSVNTGNHWVEIQAMRMGVNKALNKSISTTGTIATTWGTGDINSIVDGDTNTANYVDNGAGFVCVTVDLEEEYDLSSITIWHYYNSGRTYYSNTTYVSDDNTSWTPVIATTASGNLTGKSVTAYDSI